MLIFCLNFQANIVKIKRRNFNKLLTSTILASSFSFKSYAENYSGPVNWAGVSFLLPFSEIKTLMPVTKAASEFKSDLDNASYFNSYLNKSLKEKPIKNIDLRLEGFAKDATLAFTYGFSAEFDFGEFKDNEINKTAYLMYSFGQSLLYNVYDRVIISSVPIRAISTNLISEKESIKYPDIKAELMKRAFYNSSNPQSTMLEQFRIMVGKQSFKKKEWEGKKPRVVLVSLAEDGNNLFNNFGLSKEQFMSFLGQSSTFAFGYKLESPILPFMMNAALTKTTISRFDFATKLYNKIDVKLPNPDLEIKIYHQGWEFAEETYQENAKSLLKVSLGMAIEIEIYDNFDEKVLYKQYFFAEKTYIAGMAPRGIVAAAISSLFAFKLEAAGYIQAVEFVPITFLIIIVSVTVYGLIGRPLSRLLQLKPDQRGVILVGAHLWARELANVLSTIGISVLLIDTNKENIIAAKDQQLDTLHGSILSKKIQETVETSNMDLMLNITASDETNLLASMEYADMFGENHVLRLYPKDRKKDLFTKQNKQDFLFSDHVTYTYLNSKKTAGSKIKTVPLTDQLSYEKYVSKHVQDIPLFYIDKNTRLHIISDFMTISPSSGCTLIVMG